MIHPRPSAALTRRALVAGAVLTPLAGQAAPAQILRAAAARAGVTFGASISSSALADARYGALYRRQCALVTTDYALKFDALRPDPETFAFDDANALLAFAESNGIDVKGHALVWNENTPDWLRRLGAREVTRVFDAHIEKVVSRYAGRLVGWDVVNEPFWPGHGKPGGWRDGPWYAAMGPAYVERAFARVRAIDKKAVLLVNEAHCEIDNDWGRGIRPCLARLVEDLRHKGVPLGAVGLQGHLQPQWAHDYARFAAWAAGLAIELSISELDCNDESFPDDPAARDARVADTYRAFLTPVLAVPAVRSVVTWQLADGFSWYREFPSAGAHPGRRPLPFDADLRPKPAYAALLDALGGAPHRP